MRNVKYEELQVFILLFLVGINKLGNNLIYDFKFGLWCKLKYFLYSEVLVL